MFSSSDFAKIASFIQIEWSHLSPLCALIPNADQRVHFFNDKGNEYKEYMVSRSARATVIAFSQTSDSLAIGFNDGEVSLWRSGNTNDAPHVHEGPVNLLCWHPNCPYFLSASEDGCICCWNTATVIVPLFKACSSVIFTRSVWSPSEIPFAFLASSEGLLFSFENGSEDCLNEICSCPKPIHLLRIVPAAHRVVVVSGENYLSQYNLPPNIAKYNQLKLPAGDPPLFTTIRSDTLAYAIADTIYVSNFQNEEIQILRTKSSQKVTSLNWNSSTAELYATTIEGCLYVWKTTMKGLVSKLGWEAPIITDLFVRIEEAYWSPYSKSFATVTTGKRPSLFIFYPFHNLACKDYIVWQKTPNSLTTDDTNETKLHAPILQAGMSNSYLMFNSMPQCNLFNIHKGSLAPFSNITINSDLVALKDEVIFDCIKSTLEVRNLQGTVKETMSISTPAKFMCLNGRYLCIISEDYTIMLYDVQRRSPKIQFTTIFTTEYDNIRIRDVSLSCGGFCLSISVDFFKDGQWHPSPNLYLHSPQFDKTVSLVFEGRIPKCHKWDSEDSRLLCVETIPFDINYESSVTGTIVFPLFVADSLESFKQAPLNLDSDLEEIWYVELPRIYHSKPQDKPVGTVLPQFEGLNNADETSKKALMELNFHLATGNIDAAFNAIRGIDNKATWRSLAQTCAQMRRIDLADLCFGKMEDGGSALILQKAQDDPIAQNIIVDTQLGMIDEAKTIAKENRRFDLLSNIHCSIGEYSDALAITSSGDRIHMKALAYQNARSAEIIGNIEQAIKLYESSGMLPYELPRLAIQQNDLLLLFNYISERSPAEISPRLWLWLGRFYEAHQQVDVALQYYEYARATSESVRLLCCVGRWDDALAIVKKSNKRSTTCSYARLLIDKIDYLKKKSSDSANSKKSDDDEIIRLQHEVIEMFRSARQFAQAMDIALKYELVDDVLALSFSAPAPLVCRAAQWFEERREAKNAILLYSRSGRLNRALALCFAMKQYDALDEISDSLNSKTDPQVLIRCGRYFIESERWSKAAQCLAFARQFEEAIEICNKHSVKLQPNVIQELSNIQADPKVLQRFASLCEQQGEFAIAASLYVKLKDHVASMKALIRSGDTSKVVKFANLIKKKETYILAANYLATFKPREGQQVFDTIVTLYSKAKAPDKLSRFYQASAQVEIEDYQDYEKGLELVKKARDIIEKIENLKNKDQLMSLMNNKIDRIEKYLAAINSIKSEPKRGLQLCVELLKSKDIENYLRTDDIYIVMVQCYVAQGNYKKAHKILEDLKNSGTDITWYMDVAAIQKIYKEVGETFDTSEIQKNEDEYEEVDDEIVEDIQDTDI